MQQMSATANHLENHFLKFVHILRYLGLRVSTAEAMDALRGLQAIDLLDRQQVQGVLRATLVKNQHDQRVFCQAFDSYFVTPEIRQQRLQHRQQGLDHRAEELAQAAEMLSFADLEEEAGEQITLSQEELATYTRMPEEPRQRLQEYFNSQSAGNSINDPRKALANVIHSQLAYWKRKLAQVHPEDEEQRPLELTGEDEIDEVLEHVVANTSPEQGILHQDMQHIPPEQLQQASNLINKMARKLATRMSRRYRQSAKKQRIDLRKTVRYNLRYGGIPLVLRYRAQRINRPKLVLVCDVSGSMARYATFVLQFIYGLSSAVGKIESFIFAEELERVTPYFQTPGSFTDIMLEVMNRSSQWGRGTNLGTTLQALWEHQHHHLSAETTVFLVSDGKSLAPELAEQYLSKIAGRCSSVIWLNTLPQREWAQSRVLSLFSKHCRMLECSTLAHLERILRQHIV